MALRGRRAGLLWLGFLIALWGGLDKGRASWRAARAAPEGRAGRPRGKRLFRKPRNGGRSACLPQPHCHVRGRIHIASWERDWQHKAVLQGAWWSPPLSTPQAAADVWPSLFPWSRQPPRDRVNNRELLPVSSLQSVWSSAFKRVRKPPEI